MSWILWVFLGCSGNLDTAVNDCNGDIDGLGTDTGNLPGLYGNWTTTFGSRSFYEDCGLEGLNHDAFSWVNGGVMNIGGRLDAPTVTFAGLPDAELTATMSQYGASTISGRAMFRGQELHIAIGGLLFENPLLNIIELEGHAYMGVDSNDDGYVDCGIMGDFNGKQSQ